MNQLTFQVVACYVICQIEQAACCLIR
jgi:hypothetical protein